MENNMVLAGSMGSSLRSKSTFKKGDQPPRDSACETYRAADTTAADTYRQTELFSAFMKQPGHSRSASADACFQGNLTWPTRSGGEAADCDTRSEVSQTGSFRSSMRRRGGDFRRGDGGMSEDERERKRIELEKTLLDLEKMQRENKEKLEGSLRREGSVKLAEEGGGGATTCGGGSFTTQSRYNSVMRKRVMKNQALAASSRIVDGADSASGTSPLEGPATSLHNTPRRSSSDARSSPPPALPFGGLSFVQDISQPDLDNDALPSYKVPVPSDNTPPISLALCRGTTVVQQSLQSARATSVCSGSRGTYLSPREVRGVVSARVYNLDHCGSSTTPALDCYKGEGSSRSVHHTPTGSTATAPDDTRSVITDRSFIGSRDPVYSSSAAHPSFSEREPTSLTCEKRAVPNESSARHLQSEGSNGSTLGVLHSKKVSNGGVEKHLGDDRALTSWRADPEALQCVSLSATVPLLKTEKTVLMTNTKPSSVTDDILPTQRAWIIDFHAGKYSSVPPLPRSSGATSADKKTSSDRCSPRPAFKGGSVAPERGKRTGQRSAKPQQGDAPTPRRKGALLRVSPLVASAVGPRARAKGTSTADKGASSFASPLKWSRVAVSETVSKTPKDFDAVKRKDDPPPCTEEGHGSASRRTDTRDPASVRSDNRTPHPRGTALSEQRREEAIRLRQARQRVEAEEAALLKSTQERAAMSAHSTGNSVTKASSASCGPLVSARLKQGSSQLRPKQGTTVMQASPLSSGSQLRKAASCLKRPPGHGVVTDSHNLSPLLKVTACQPQYVDASLNSGGEAVEPRKSVPVPYCIECGKKHLDETGKFCAFCGHKREFV